jgi:hypothetical protein
MRAVRELLREEKGGVNLFFFRLVFLRDVTFQDLLHLLKGREEGREKEAEVEKRKRVFFSLKFSFLRHGLAMPVVFFCFGKKRSFNVHVGFFKAQDIRAS